MLCSWVAEVHGLSRCRRSLAGDWHSNNKLNWFREERKRCMLPSDQSSHKHFLLCFTITHITNKLRQLLSRSFSILAQTDRLTCKQLLVKTICSSLGIAIINNSNSTTSFISAFRRSQIGQLRSPSWNINNRLQHTATRIHQRISCQPEASNDLHAPCGDSIPSLVNWAVVLGCIQRLVPPTIAASHSPVRIARSAWSSASRLDEQAVSTAKLGPATNLSHSHYNWR